MALHYLQFAERSKSSVPVVAQVSLMVDVSDPQWNSYPAALAPLDPMVRGAPIPEPLRVQYALTDSDPFKPLETADLQRDADAQVKRSAHTDRYSITFEPSKLSSRRVSPLC